MEDYIKDRAYIKVLSKLMSLKYEIKEIEYMTELDEEVVRSMLLSNRREMRIYEYILNLIQVDQ